MCFLMYAKFLNYFDFSTTYKDCHRITLFLVQTIILPHKYSIYRDIVTTFAPRNLESMEI